MCPQCGLTDSKAHRRGVFHKHYDELCFLISQGRSEAEIAQKFGISRQRVRKLIFLIDKERGDVPRTPDRRFAPPMTQLAILLEHMEAGRWHDALKLASGWARLGTPEQKVAITRAADALKHPEFHRQLRKNPDKLIAEGIEALKTRYWKGRRKP